MNNKIILFLLIFCLISNFIFIKNVNKLENDKIYSMYVKVDGNSMEIIKVDNISVSKSLYLKNNIKLEDGYYTVKCFYKNKNCDILDYNSNLFNKIRQYLYFKIDKNYENYEISSFIKATLLGFRSGLDDDLNKNFKYLGISHLFSISGLHISLIVLFLDSLFLKLKNKEYFIFIIIFIYSFLIGFSVSIKRVLFMYLFYIFFKDKKTSYIYTLLLFLSLNLYNILNPSFIYSFLSIFVIFFIYPIIKRNVENKFIILFTSYFLLQITLMPFIYYFNKTINILGFVINILLIPIFTFYLEIIFLNLFLNILDITIFNFIISNIYYSLKSLLYYISKINFISIKFEKAYLEVFIILICLLIYFYINIFYNKKKR